MVSLLKWKASEVISMNLLNDVYNIGGFLSNQKDNVYFVPMKKRIAFNAILFAVFNIIKGINNNIMIVI